MAKLIVPVMKKNVFNRIEALHERIQEMLLNQLPADLGHMASIGFRVPYGPAHFYVPLTIELTPDNAEDVLSVSGLQRGLSVPPMSCYDVTIEMNGAGTFLKFYIKIPNQLQEEMKVLVDQSPGIVMVRVVMSIVTAKSLAKLRSCTQSGMTKRAFYETIIF